MENYIIISPVRDEEKNIIKTIVSVCSQTVKPRKWLIINDGSTDGTVEIINRYLADNTWIVLYNRKNRGYTEVGKGVVEAFNEAYKYIKGEEWNYIVKLDCDVLLPNDYFERLLMNFKDNPALGIAGGTSYTCDNKYLVEERMPIYHPWAGARVYRNRCFVEIGGLAETLGWDTIDLLRAQIKGWQTKRFENLKIVHLRRMSSRKGLWEGKLRTGKNFYITGYHPIFLIIRSIYRLFQRPYFIESIGVIAGYFGAMIRKELLVVSCEEKKHLQKQQFRRLFGFKI